MNSYVVKDMFQRLRDPEWNIVKEVLHIVWAYGQKGHALEKKNTEAWNGMKMYQSFFRLDADEKDFQVIGCCGLYLFRMHYCNHHLRLMRKANHLLSQRLWMTDLSKKNTKVSSFVYPVSAGVANATSFKPPVDLNRIPDRKWLVETGKEARGLTDQRSNIELFCILTCCARAQVIEKDAFTPVHDEDIQWVENINRWAASHKELAKNAHTTVAYWKKYGFALYHNVSSSTFKRVQATYTRFYRMSGADKNIGLVLYVADYLLGMSAIGGDKQMEAEEDVASIVDALFGGNYMRINTGLRMIKAYYTRDYNLISSEEERMRCMNDGSFPVGGCLL